MAVNIARAGFELTVCDVRPEPLEAMAGLGAAVVGSPHEVGERAEIVGIAEIADPDWVDEDVEAVVLGPDGVLRSARPGSIIALHSAIHPSAVRRMAEQTEARGVHLIDAQANGGEDRARAQRLIYMVGGDPAVLERCRPVFAASGEGMYHTGALGTGAAAKLAHYILVCATLQAVSEGMRVAEAAGVDLQAFQQLVHVSAGQSWASDNWLKDFRPMSPARAENLYNRLHHALLLGHDLGVPLPASALAQQFLSVV
jgi:3-hydroxyisobutyrate dehydrogenase-like beta-hydroxyacid dehydrogenase